MAHEIHPTRDGNYVVSGYTERGTDSREFDALVAKLDENGRVIWRRMFPTRGDDDLFYTVAEPVGGGYVVGGDKQSNGWVAALDPDGNPTWERTFHEIQQTMVWRVRAARDGGVMIAGSARTSAGAPAKLWLAKLDQQGTTLWSRTYWSSESWGKTGEALPFALCATADGGYLVAAVNDWVGLVWLLKVDGNGATLWERTLQRKGNVLSILETTPGEYVLAGMVQEGNNNKAWIGRLDSIGELTWERDFDAATPNAFYAISETADGGYIAVGRQIVRLSAHGELVWEREVEKGTGIVSIERAPDGGYIAAGRKKDAVWVLKLDAQASPGDAK